MMRTTSSVLLTAAAALLLGGYAAAHAQPAASRVAPEAHVMVLQLPGGQVEQIRYTGDVPPVVVLAPQAMPAGFDPMLPFAMLDRMAADMDRQAAAMLRDIGTLTAPDTGASSVIGALSGPGVCARSVRITYTGNGEPPHIVSRTSGSCGVERQQELPAGLPAAPASRPAPEVIQAKATIPYQGLVHTVSDVQR